MIFLCDIKSMLEVVAELKTPAILAQATTSIRYRFEIRFPTHPSLDYIWVIGEVDVSRP